MTDQKIICAECEIGLLKPAEFSDTFIYNGKELEVAGLEKYVCDTCGAEPIYPHQVRKNEKLFAQAKRDATGRKLLSGDEIKAIRARIGITQQEAAICFGGGQNAFSKYERGIVVQSESMDRLVRLIDRYPFMLADLIEFSGCSGVKAAAHWVDWLEATPFSNESHQPTRVVGGDAVVVQFEEYRQLKRA